MLPAPFDAKGVGAFSVAYELKGVSKAYGRLVRANREISVSIEQGEAFGLLGPNGAGKSTLVRQMVGLCAPSRGQIWLFGQRVRPGQASVKHVVGYLPQRPLALYDLTVLEALIATGRLRGLTTKVARQRADDLLRRFDLGDRQTQLINHLSGGEHRLVGLMSLLVACPSVLVLDEPSSELDAFRRRVLWQVLNEQHQAGKTLVIVSHNIQEVEASLDRAALLHHGRILAVDTVMALKQRFGIVKVSLQVRGGQRLSPWLIPYRLQPLGDKGHYQGMLAKEEVTVFLRTVGQAGVASTIEALTIAVPTLEDVYLGLQRGDRSDGH